MKKNLHMSALLTGLLAAPVLGATAAPVRPLSAPPAATAPVQSFPMQMPAAVADRLRRWLRGESFDVNGMQGLQRRMLEDVQEKIVAMQADPALWPVQVQNPTVTPQILAPTEKSAFLGITASPVNEALRDQLNLGRGLGLTIEYVEEGSPAAAANLRVTDVLAKLDDQWLINPHQFAVLVRNKKPGDAITLTVLRGGQPQTVALKLAEKEVAVLETLRMQDAQLTMNTPGRPPSTIGAQELIIDPRGATARGAVSVNNLQPTIPNTEVVSRNEARVSIATNTDGTWTRRLIDDAHDITVTRNAQGSETLSVKDRAGKVIYEGAAENATLGPELAKKIADLRARSGEVRIQIGGPGAEVDGTARAVTMTRSDGEHDIALKLDGTGRHVTVKDTAGKVLYDGPANAEEDLRGMAPEIAEKVRTMMAKVK